jgi:hypothetical protein
MGLFVYSLSLEPVEMEIGDLSTDDVGSFVSVKGMVASVRQTSGGGLSLILTDGRDCVHVYVPEQRSSVEDRLLPGSLVSVKGEVQIYDGELEIYVSSPADIRIEDESAGDSIPPGVLAEMPETFEGETLRVHGSIRHIRVMRDAESEVIGTSFDLSSDGYEIPCIVFGWDWEADPMDIAENRLTVFEATWSYYSREASWQLTSDRPSFGD